MLKCCTGRHPERTGISVVILAKAFNSSVKITTCLQLLSTNSFSCDNKTYGLNRQTTEAHQMRSLERVPYSLTCTGSFSAVYNLSPNAYSGYIQNLRGKTQKKVKFLFKPFTSTLKYFNTTWGLLLGHKILITQTRNHDNGFYFCLCILYHTPNLFLPE